MIGFLFRSKKRLPDVGQRRFVPHSALGMKIPFESVCVSTVDGKCHMVHALSKPKGTWDE